MGLKALQVIENLMSHCLYDYVVQDLPFRDFGTLYKRADIAGIELGCYYRIASETTSFKL